MKHHWPEGCRRRRGAREKSELGTCRFEEGSPAGIGDVCGTKRQAVNGIDDAPASLLRHFHLCNPSLLLHSLTFLFVSLHKAINFVPQLPTHLLQFSISGSVLKLLREWKKDPFLKLLCQFRVPHFHFLTRRKKKKKKKILFIFLLVCFLFCFNI